MICARFWFEGSLTMLHDETKMSQHVVENVIRLIENHVLRHLEAHVSISQMIRSSSQVSGNITVDDGEWLLLGANDEHQTVLGHQTVPVLEARPTLDVDSDCLPVGGHDPTTRFLTFVEVHVEVRVGSARRFTSLAQVFHFGLSLFKIRSSAGPREELLPAHR
jgi:hypothetical protein